MKVISLHTKQWILRIMVYFSIFMFLGVHISIMFTLCNNEQAQIMLNMGMEEEHKEKNTVVLNEHDAFFDSNKLIDLLDLSDAINVHFHYNEPVIELPPRPPQG